MRQYATVRGFEEQPAPARPAISAADWHRLDRLYAFAGWLGLALSAVCLAQWGGWGDDAGRARMAPPVLTALLGFTFRLRHPRPPES